ncbi:MAG: sigma 54-interacting transcriptional regulator, partial [Candidatus Micrarchaeia archaeon]
RKGAFTGASYERKGLIGEANGGTLFLDEVSEIPLFLQGKLLRFLDTSLYRRVGEDKERVSKCGVIFATNRNLKKEVEEGRMRKDLYFRINVHTLFIPPLRERKEDIEDIAKYYCMKNGFSINESAIKELKEYNFPGNVRELENILENLGRKGREINGRMVKEFLSSKISEPVMRREGRGMTLREILSEFEREVIEKALEESGWNVTKAAKILKISRQNLQRRIRKLKIRNN